MAYLLKRFSSILFFAAGIAAALPGCSNAGSGDDVSLVVVVAVDQLTPDLLNRYAGAFEGGFARLARDGHIFADAVHDHASTFTGPGHATIVTGVVPARSGIVGNSWREWRNDEWVTVSAAEDPEVSIVGSSGTGISPRNLLRDALPDWLLAVHPGARVVSISGKAPVAALMAGHGGRHAYWFDISSAGFVTSTYYRVDLPDWVRSTNQGLVERATGEGCWTDELLPEVAALSRRDEVEWEADGTHVAFPHCVSDAPYRSAAHFVSRTPALDVATFELARASVRALELGRRESPDYLALGLSATDRIGHEFGPWSREQLVNLVQLDRELGEFMTFLDEQVGVGHYLLALTSDHGVLPMPEHLVEQGEPGLRITGGFNSWYRQALGDLGPTGGEHRDETAAEHRSRLATELERVDWIERGLPLELLAGTEEGDSILDLYRASFHPDRLGTRVAQWGVEALPDEATLVRGSGTTHGQPWMHDRAVPLVFFGPGVGAGVTMDPVRTVDLAPTLADLLGIPAPDDLDGVVLRTR
jgi:hypothetical protein